MSTLPGQGRGHSSQATKRLHIRLPQKNHFFVQYLGSNNSRASPRTFVWGDGFMGTEIAEIHLPQKFSFYSDFGHFIFKMLKNAKFPHV